MVPPLRTTELTFPIPEHHLNEVMHTATDGRNGLFAPLLSRLRFAAIRGDLLISDTPIYDFGEVYSTCSCRRRLSTANLCDMCTYQEHGLVCINFF